MNFSNATHRVNDVLQHRLHNDPIERFILKRQIMRITNYCANPDGSYKTWALDRQSEAALDQWMHANLDVAYATARGATSFEAQLIDLFNPAINLNGCHQTDGHRLIKQLRRRMDERMKHCLS